MLFVNGVYFLAYKLLKYVDYKGNNELLILESKAVFLMSVAKLDRVSGYAKEYNDLINELSGFGYYKKITKLKYEWLLTSLRSVSIDEAFRTIEKLEEYTDKQKDYMKFHLYYNQGKHDIILKKLD